MLKYCTLLLLLLCALAATASAAGTATGLGPRGLNCTVEPPRPPPTVVTDLRPQDVELVMAMGDSITAAFAVEGGLWEYRHESWSIGMGEGATTLPNYIRAFSPKVTGGSTTAHFPEIKGTPHSYPSDHLNAAQSGAKVVHLLGQAEYLVEKLAAIQGSDQMWKVLTIWISANDVCEVCKPGQRNGTESAANFEKDFDEALSLIHAKIPRAFVNVVPLMHLSALGKIVHQSSGCMFEHGFFDECHCVFHGTPADWQVMDNMTDVYNEIQTRVAAKYSALSKTQAFVIQPFLTKSIIPDLSYVSTLDCFHPTLKAHSDLATVLFNQMLLPKAQKITALPPGKWYQEPTCPGTGVFRTD